MTSEKSFEQMWEIMNARQRDEYAVALVINALSESKITANEASAVIENIADYSRKLQIPIPFGLIKMLKVVTAGGVRFTIEDNHFITQSVESVDLYIKFVASLPIEEQMRVKNKNDKKSQRKCMHLSRKQ